MQAHHVGGGEQRVERHGDGAERLRRGRVTRRGIVKTDAAAGAVERLRDRLSDRAKSDNADQQAVEPGQVVGDHAGAEGGVVAFLDFRVGPGEAPQQDRGRRYGIFGDRAIAAARHIGDRNAELRQRLAVETVDACAGNLHQLETAALEQRGRELRPHRRNDECVGSAHEVGERGIVRLAIGNAQACRRRRVDACKIGFGPQAENIVAHGCVRPMKGVRSRGSSRSCRQRRRSGKNRAGRAARRLCYG